MAGVRACSKMLGSYTKGNFGRRMGFSGGQMVWPAEGVEAL